MAIGNAPKLDSLYVSRGQSFVTTVHLGKSYPTGTLAKIVIKNDADNVLATWTGNVYDGRAYFNEISSTVTDNIPHGAKFNMFLQFGDGYVLKHSYGRVVRAENSYNYASGGGAENPASYYFDSFERNAVGNNWVTKAGALAINKHPLAAKLPNSLGPDINLFKDASALWYAPLNSDTFTITTAMLYVGDGRCTVVCCADSGMTTWLGVQFSTGVFNDKIRIVRGNGPTSWAEIPGSYEANNLIKNGDVYTIRHFIENRAIAVFKNNDLTTPVVYWQDDNQIIPTGPGKRYVGLLWNTAAFTPGAEPSSWSARDGV